MNKRRILGVILIVIGIILQLTYENGGKDIITGFLIGGGVILIISN